MERDMITGAWLPVQEPRRACRSFTVSLSSMLVNLVWLNWVGLHACFLGLFNNALTVQFCVGHKTAIGLANHALLQQLSWACGLHIPDYALLFMVTL